MAIEIPTGPVVVTGPLPEAIRAAIAQFNASEYYECHDTIEAHWVSEPGVVRVLYQGILQIGVGYYHIQCGNWRGAVKMFERGLPKLAPFLPACQGIDVSALQAAARKALAVLEALGPEGVSRFDPALFPQIAVRE